nr:peptide deformylase [Adlercreutzia sp. ZJ473]
MRYHGTRNVSGQKENAVIKEIVKDEAILSQACEKATADDASVAQDLVETLVSLEDAAGLAANQIGETKAVVAYLDDDDNPHVMYNPVLKQGLAPFKAIEACLSREEEKKVTRFARIQVAYQELVDGELVERKRRFEGWTAQVIQHLIDHCKGKLI